MKRLLIVFALLLLGPLGAFAQTKEETIAFITSEYRSFEGLGYTYKQVAFSPGGDAFTLRRTAQGRKEYVVTFRLKDVDIYKVTLNHANGINRHQLMVRPRGAEPNMARDGFSFKAPMKITPAMEDERKCQALERAFTHLTTLTTGRKFLFSTN
jgi:uncharacterized protein YkuJ